MAGSRRREESPERLARAFDRVRPGTGSGRRVEYARDSGSIQEGNLKLGASTAFQARPMVMVSVEDGSGVNVANGMAKIEIGGRIGIAQAREWMEARRAALARHDVLALERYSDSVVELVAGRLSMLARPSDLSVKDALAKHLQVAEVVESWCGHEGLLAAPMGVTFAVEAERTVGRDVCRAVVDEARKAGWRDDGLTPGRQKWMAYRLVPAAEDVDGLGGTVTYWRGPKPEDESVLVWGETRPHHIGMQDREGEGLAMVRRVVEGRWREWVERVLEGPGPEE